MKINKFLFMRTLKKIKERKKLFFFIIGFDLLMFLSFGMINLSLGAMMPNQFGELSLFLGSLLFLFAIFYSLLYFGLITFTYSFFKYCILDLIMSFSEKHKFNFKRFWKFYILNLKIIIFPAVLLFIFTLLISFVIQEKYAAYILLTLLLPIFFFYYPFLNFCHSFFYLGKKRVISRSFKIIFKNIKSYLGIYLSSLLIIIVYYIISLIITVVFKFTIFRTEELYYSYYPGYIMFYNLMTAVLLYLIIVINRISFFDISEKV